jgi:CDP-diacylglycerol--glycerol-3-phosphate 3-phosphatidyltransferase
LDAEPTPMSPLLVSRIPIVLTALRALLAPVVVFLAIYYPSQSLFGTCLLIAFVSDIFDGILARRLNVVTPNLRRLDSIADSVFYIAAVFAVWHLYPAVIKDHLPELLILGSLEIGRYVFDFVKFKREASYHMWSSKLWGIFLFVGFFSLLALGMPGLPVTLAIYAGIIADIEGLAISMILPEWKTDVPTFVHALRNRGI